MSQSTKRTISNLSISIGIALVAWPIRSERARWGVSVDGSPPRMRAVRGGLFASPFRILLNGLRTGQVRRDGATRVLLGVAVFCFGIIVKTASK